MFRCESARYEGNSWIRFSFGHRVILSESSLSSRITTITIARIPLCPVMLRLNQRVKTMLGGRAWLTTAGDRIVEGFFTHLHLYEYEFAMDSS